MTAARRRLWWRVGMVASIVLGVANIAAFLTGVMSHGIMDLVTNALSWLAITFTFQTGCEAATPNERET